MSIIHPEILAAVENYFVAKYKGGDGLFREKGLKKRVCTDIINVCYKLDLCCDIVPGLIIIHDANYYYFFNKDEHRRCPFVVSTNVDDALDIYFKRNEK